MISPGLGRTEGLGINDVQDQGQLHFLEPGRIFEERKGCGAEYVYPLVVTNIAMENVDLMGKTIGKW